MNDYKIRRILVPVDLSEASINALDTAVVLAKKHCANIFLLSVTEKLSLLTEPASSTEVLLALAGAVTHADDVVPVVLRADGCVVDCIAQTALEKRCDLVVMGTHGASGYRDGFIGSTAYSTIKYSACPVLTVPPKRKYTSFKRILYPIRPVTGALQRYDTVSKFLSSNASVEVMGLSYRPGEEENNLLEKIVEEISPQLTGRVKIKTLWGKTSGLPEAVLNYAQHTLPDLIVVTSVLDIISKSNYIGPHAQKIIHNAKVPVLSTKKVGIPVLA